jgi:hypothetical protein
MENRKENLYLSTERENSGGDIVLPLDFASAVAALNKTLQEGQTPPAKARALPDSEQGNSSGSRDCAE